MEEATGAPSSFADWDPRRLRASGRAGGGIVNRPPSSLTMLLSRHTRRREFITLLGGAAARGRSRRARSRQSGCGGSACSRTLRRMIRNQWPALPRFRRACDNWDGPTGCNVRIDFRWGAGDVQRVRRYAAELVAACARRHTGPWRHDRRALATGDPHRADRVRAIVDPVGARFRRQLVAAGRQRYRVLEHSNMVSA